ncbi:MAG: N-acetylmuramoyl-L-alanine amidase, partial [Limisphaerales bacterium]
MAVGSSDYGPAIWNPPCNADYYTSGYGHKFHVIHDIEGYYLSTISYFKGCGYTSASIHSVVNGLKDSSSDAPAGEITQMVADANYAWHARCWNQHSTGTEHEGFASNPAWYTDAQYQASAGITANLSAKFGWAKDRNHVVAHGQKSVAGWPGYASANLGIDPYCNTHTDPGPYWDWTKYMGYVNGGSVISGGVDATSRGVGKLDVFVRGTDNRLKQRYYDSAIGWSAWIDHGGVLTSDPTVAAWDSNRLDVFVRDTGNALNHKSWSSTGGWSGWDSLGGQLGGGADACSRGPGLLDVFVRGIDNHLYQIAYNGVAWSGWIDLGGTLTSDPTAVARGSDRIDVFVRDVAGNLNTKYWTSTAGW